MDIDYPEFDMKEWLEERLEALLSMDKNKIYEYSRKYYCCDGDNEADEHAFWVSVHKTRSGAIDLPESERRVSMAWLTERGLTHLAYDLKQI